MSLTGGIELAPLKVELKADIAGFKNDMSKAAALGAAEANRISESMAGTIKVGERLTSVGNSMTKFVSLPLAAAGAGAVSMALDFGNSFTKVSTLLDDSVVDFEEYKDAIIDGSNESKTAIDDYSESLYQAISAGVDQTEAIEFTTDAMDLARAGFTTGAASVDLLTTAINGYQLEAEDATKISDMLIATQNAGKTTVDELAASMGKVIPVANSVNFGMDELSASYAQLTYNGIATAEAGTYLRSMLSELGKTGSDADKALRELSGKGFAQLKEEGVPTADILKMLGDYAANSGLTLKDMFGSVEGGTAALIMASEDGEQFNDFLGRIENSAGSTQTAIDKLNSDPLEQLKGSINELKNAGIELGEAMTPAISELAGIISDLAGAFSDLDDGQQKMIVDAGIALAVAGPLLSVGGKVVTTFGKIKPLIAGANTALSSLGGASTAAAAEATTLAGEVAGVGTAAAATEGAASGLAGTLSGVLGGSIGTAAVAVGAFGAAIGGVAVAGVEAYKQLNEDVVPEVDIFTSTLDEVNQKMADNAGNTAMVYQAASGQYKKTAVEISEATKTAVNSYMMLDTEAQKSLMNLYLNGSEITGDIVMDMTTKYASMGETINSSLESDYSERVSMLQNLFDESSSITAEQQAETYSSLQTNLDSQKAANEQYQADINAIMQTAADQHRSLTQEEWQTVSDIQGQMKASAITTLSETEAESAVILGRIKDQDGRITAETASEHVKALEDQRIKTVDAANLEYEQRIAAIEQMKADGTITSQEMADQMIADAARQRDETIASAQATKDQGIEVLKGAYSDLEANVDTNTGEILTKWDRIKAWWAGWNPERKDANVYTNEEAYFDAVNRISGSWANLSFPTKYALVQMEYVGANMDASIRDDTNYNYNGINYVPYDGFQSTLHKGERVLTAEENKEYIQGKNNSSNSSQTIVVQSVLDGKIIAESIFDNVDALAGEKTNLKSRGMP